MVTAFNEDKTAFKYLTKQSLDLSVSANDKNILHILAVTSCGDLLQYLDLYQITNSVLNHQDESLQTALHLAAIENDQTAIKWLLDKGADSSIKNSLGKTPFDLCNDENAKKLFSNQ